MREAEPEKDRTLTSVASDTDRTRFRDALSSVLRWAAAQNYLGYEKHDALNSPFLWALAGWSKWPRLIAIQVVMRFPLNVRPLLGVPRALNPKGLALFLRTQLDLYQIDGDAGHLREAQRLAEMLVQDQGGEGLHGRGWGYHYPWQDLGFFAPSRTPNAVVTAFVCDALMRLHEVSPSPVLVEATGMAMKFFLEDLVPLKDTSEELCLGYMPFPMSMRVMDVSALVAAVMARQAKLTGAGNLLPSAARLMRYVVRRQTAEGAWYYTDPPGDSPVRIDNYHTGFILDAIQDYMDLTGDHGYRDAYERGLQFYANHLFEADGAPRWMSDAAFPRDIHGAAQGIITFSRHRAAFPGLAEKIAGWALKHLYSGRGYFYYQQRRFYRTPYTFMRWCNAWMARALAAALLSAHQSGNP